MLAGSAADLVKMVLLCLQRAVAGPNGRPLSQHPTVRPSHVRTAVSGDPAVVACIWARQLVVEAPCELLGSLLAAMQQELQLGLGEQTAPACTLLHIYAQHGTTLHPLHCQQLCLSGPESC